MGMCLFNESLFLNDVSQSDYEVLLENNYDKILKSGSAGYLGGGECLKILPSCRHARNFNAQ